jgi:hypothetical protein
VLAKLYSINAFQPIDAATLKVYSDFAAVMKKAGVDPATMFK